jgi:hypothetical protein
MKLCSTITSVLIFLGCETIPHPRKQHASFNSLLGRIPRPNIDEVMETQDDKLFHNL